MTRRFKFGFVALAAATLLGACSHLPAGMQNAIGNAAGRFAVLTPEERVTAAVDLLERGDEAGARNQLEAALRQEPNNAQAKRLLDEIETDPRLIWGERNHAYVVRPGDTMASLAERRLGDRRRSYGLARYNNMAPNELRAGQTILIPDRVRNASASRPAGTQSPSAPAAPVAVSAEAAARANRLRLQALERLNGGDADGAVVLLTQAQAVDASNPVIQRDLARAQRIKASLRAP